MLTISELPRIFGWTCIKNNFIKCVNGNKKYLESKNEDTVNMTEDQIKKALTGENVFLSSQMGILDAMENFNIDIVV